MAGLLNLVPQYLPRYGMAPEWARATRPLVLLFTVINLVVTLIFKASVEAQGGAYATGVLVLITSACVASVIDIWQRREGPWYARLSWPFLLITLVFVYTTVANVFEKPDGIKIAGFFIAADPGHVVLARGGRGAASCGSPGSSSPTRSRNCCGTRSAHLELTVLVPHRPGRRSLANKEAQIRREHRIPRDLMIVFVEVELADAERLRQRAGADGSTQEEGRYVMKITGRRVDRAHARGAGAGDGEGRPPAGDPLRLDRRQPGERDARVPAVRRGQRAVDGARADREGRARPDEAAEGDDRGRVTKPTERASCNAGVSAEPEAQARPTSRPRLRFGLGGHVTPE